MRINSKSIFWGLVGIGVTILGMVVSSKQDDADFEDRMDEYLETHDYTIIKKED